MLKTMSLRLMGSKTELESAGLDAENMATSVSKLRAEILALSGVDIQKTNDSFKDMYDIIEELAAVWKDMDNMSQAAILTLIGGARGGNILSSIITNWQDAAGAAQAASEAFGTAERLQAEYLDSIQGKTAKMSASFQELSTNMINSGLIKGIYDVGNGFLSFLNIGESVIPKLLLLPTAFAALPGIFKTLKDIPLFSNIKDGFTNILKLKRVKFLGH